MSKMGLSLTEKGTVPEVIATVLSTIPIAAKSKKQVAKYFSKYVIL